MVNASSSGNIKPAMVMQAIYTMLELPFDEFNLLVTREDTYMNLGTEEKPDMRTVLHFHPALAPVKIGVLPLSKKLNKEAEEVFAQLSKKYNCEFDDRGTIGKRYRRQDEIGTPFCVTFDFDSLEDGCVTVRDRDTMEQERIAIADLDAYFEDKFRF